MASDRELGDRDEAGRGDDRPDYGRGELGVEEQGGWRGPGVGPGYRASGQRVRPFQQGEAGGQIPGERRQWSPNLRPELVESGPPGSGRQRDMPGSGAQADDAVALAGEVETRAERRAGEDIAAEVAGVADVIGRLPRQRRGPRS